MPYQLNWSTALSSQIDALPFGLSKNSTFQVSSSNAIQQTINVTASAWTAMSIGGLTDVIAITIYNDNSINSASIVQVGTGSAGQNTLATLQPGMTTVIGWSGSLASLYAKVVGSAPQYGTLTAAQFANGTIQYYLQQS